MPSINNILLLSIFVFAATSAAAAAAASSNIRTKEFLRNPLIYGAIAHATANSTTIHNDNDDDSLCNLTLDTTKPIWKYFNYTGKSPNDLGFYEDCRDIENPPSPPNYYRATFLAGNLLPIYLGICYP